jgi:hypothetical protein
MRCYISRRYQFPLKQRLTMHGALADANVPSPNVTDDGEEWGVLEDQGDDIAEVDMDGYLVENTTRVVRDVNLVEIMALDPDVDEDNPELM